MNRDTLLGEGAQVEQLLQDLGNSDEILGGVDIQVPHINHLELHGGHNHQVNETVVHQVSSNTQNIRLGGLWEVLASNLLDLFANPSQTVGETGQAVNESIQELLGSGNELLSSGLEDGNNFL